MVKSELINAVSVRAKCSTATATAVLDAYMKEIKSQILRGNNVTAKGFGTFKIVTRKPKVVRNINLGTSIVIPERNIVKFIPSKDFKVKQKN